MSLRSRSGLAILVLASALAVGISGCTSPIQYIQNGFKVGPNYQRPPAAVAQHWIDAPDIPSLEASAMLCRWWTVFNDPKLNELVWCAYRQNLTLREAYFRVLQARAQLAIAQGEIFPQQQSAFGDYRRTAAAVNPNIFPPPGKFNNLWDFGFSLNWELDFWGRLRRAVTAAEANLDASVAGYDGALVTMLGDIARSYVQVRTDQERIRLLAANADVQRRVLYGYVEPRVKAGYKAYQLDFDQALSNLRQTEAQILPLEIDQRQQEDALCVLLGIPTVDLEKMLGAGPVPTAPPDVAIGIPCDLLRRRPDVRVAERTAAAQAEQIGIAEAQLYPIFTVNGNVGYQANNFADLFRYSAFNGSLGPSFQWNVLNYGRIISNVHFQDARFQELVATYQNTVLEADREVEDGLVVFLRSQRQARLLDESVAAAQDALKLVLRQSEVGSVDFNRYAVINQNLITQQDQAAAAHGQIAQGLVATYRALGGGWEIRLGGNGAAPLVPAPNGQAPREPIPAPPPAAPGAPQAPPVIPAPPGPPAAAPQAAPGPQAPPAADAGNLFRLPIAP